MTAHPEVAVIFCIIGCILGLVLKQYQKVYGMLLSLGVCGVLLLMLLPEAERIVKTARNIYEQSALEGEYFGILWKAVGIVYLTQLGADVCKDCGENAIGTAVELCGRVLLVLLGLPLFLALAEMILEVMG
ncbi:MAG: hypothetical protein IKI37_06420 [Oscillospiraceae bacterium]|nr:hypothetical protein [Oscillospiraceae bacterium]